MDFLLHQLASLKQSHPVFFALLLVPVVSIVLNGIIYFLSSPRWDQLKANWPRFAAGLKMLQAFGIDPIALMKYAFQAITGRPWTPPPSDCPPSKSKPPSAGLFGAMLVVAVVLFGCSWFSSKEPKIVDAGRDLAICVLEHAEESPEQIAADCSATAVADVIDILSAHKAAMARAGVSPDGGPPCK